MNNQPHVNQPHEPVHVAVRLFIQNLGTAPAPKDADLIAELVTDFNQWSETLSYWRVIECSRAQVAPATGSDQSQAGTPDRNILISARVRLAQSLATERGHKRS